MRAVPCLVVYLYRESEIRQVSAEEPELGKRQALRIKPNFIGSTSNAYNGIRHAHAFYGKGNRGHRDFFLDGGSGVYYWLFPAILCCFRIQNYLPSAHGVFSGRYRLLPSFGYKSRAP